MSERDEIIANANSCQVKALVALEEHAKWQAMADFWQGRLEALTATPRPASLQERVTQDNALCAYRDHENRVCCVRYALHYAPHAFVNPGPGDFRQSQEPASSEGAE